MSSDLQTIESLLIQIRDIILGARKSIVQNVNSVQVLTCFRIGHLIVEHEQQGETRAPYGKETLNQLSKRLIAEFGRGFSSTNLKLMRQFYLLKKLPIGQTVSDQLAVDDSRGIVGVLSSVPNSLTGRANALSFPLSWSHYVLLLGINQEEERRFYELEAVQQNWSVRELKRQFNSSLYERLALSRDKAEVMRLAQQGQLIEKPSDLLKEPYVLEFLGLAERNEYSESDLETAIIDKLEHFLLELGKGFLFEARQKRFTFAEDHFFIDLVFYNRLLRCYVLLDLKIGKLTHQDLGQMQMYVNYFDRYVKLADEHPTVGVILCKKKHDALVEITLPKDANIYAAQYQLYLPSKEELKQKLLDWIAEQEMLAPTNVVNDDMDSKSER